MVKQSLSFGKRFAAKRLLFSGIGCKILLKYPENREALRENTQGREGVAMIDLPLNIDFTGKVVVVTGASGVL